MGRGNDPRKQHMRPLASRGFLALALLLPLGCLAQVRIGQTIDLSGSSSEHGKAMVSGIRAFIDPLNAAGGIDGKRIEIVLLDDGGKSDRAALNTRELIERERVVAIFSGIEGGPCVASMKVAVESAVPLIGCAAGSPDFRDPFSRYVFPVRAEHLTEFQSILRMAREFGRTRFAFVHADSDNGRRHLANLTRVAAAEGSQVVVAAALGPKATPRELARQIVAGRAQAVINHGSYATYAEIYGEARKLDPTIQFYAVNSGAQQMVRLLGPSAEGIVFTQVVPLPWGATQPVVREYREAMKRFAPQEELSFSSLEGYINAKVLAQAIRRAGRNVTPDGIVRGLESAGEIDVGGFAVRYSKTAHTGSAFVDTVFTRRDGRFRAH